MCCLDDFHKKRKSTAAKYCAPRFYMKDAGMSWWRVTTDSGQPRGTPCLPAHGPLTSQQIFPTPSIQLGSKIYFFYYSPITIFLSPLPLNFFRNQSSQVILPFIHFPKILVNIFCPSCYICYKSISVSCNVSNSEYLSRRWVRKRQ